MTGHVPFSLDQLKANVELIGELEFSVDPLNGADILFYAPDMAEAAEKILIAYRESAWVPRHITASLKTVLPKGFIVGLKRSVVDGPYHDTVFMVRPDQSEAEAPVRADEAATE